MAADALCQLAEAAENIDVLYFPSQTLIQRLPLILHLTSEEWVHMLAGMVADVYLNLLLHCHYGLDTAAEKANDAFIQALHDMQHVIATAPCGSDIPYN